MNSKINKLIMELLKNLNSALYYSISEPTAFNTFLVILPAFHTAFIVIYLGLVLKITKVWKRFAIEFIIVVGGIIFCVTTLANHITHINIGLLLLTLCLTCYKIRDNLHLEQFIEIPMKRPNYVTVSRATINLITVVCILGVDFEIFPRKFGKSGDYGFGLMDVGVGLFVASNGVVSSDRRGGSLSLKKMLGVVVSCLPIIVLGVGRYFVLKLINYHVNIYEYGVHWNFFLTLASTIIIGRFIVGLVRSIRLVKYAALIILISYEIALQHGLASYIFDEMVLRDNFFASNRDGICSVLGYVSIYLITVYIGHYILTDEEFQRPKIFAQLTFQFAALSIMFWILTYVFNAFFGVSRRLANTGYVFWILAIALTMITLFNVLDLIYHFMCTKGQNWTTVDDDDVIMDEHSKSINSYVPVILSAVNYNGLIFFLIGNFLTGLVNKMFDTRGVSTTNSFVILFVYMFLVCSSITIMYLYKIKMKFW